MKKLWSLMCISAFLAMVVFSACTSDQATDPNENIGEGEEFSLDLEFGGYSAGDETAGFGDTELISDFGDNDEDVSDVFATDAAVTDALHGDSTDHKVYVVRVLWGYLEGDSTVTDPTDFSGNIEVSKGTLIALKAIRFERNQGDEIIHPRTDRKLVEFNSTTVSHLDGILVAVIDNDTTDSNDCTLTINAGAYSKTLDFSELDSIDIIEPVGANGQEVSIVSHSRDIRRFAGGFISGRWVKTGPEKGHFKGRWINSLGTNAGFLKGIWGVNRFGNKVMKGKYISRDGEFRGLLAGQWSFGRASRDAGFFAGHWVNRDRKIVGTFKGHFKTGEENTRRGFFEGRYKLQHRNRAEGDPETDG